ncbi:hypothetical protein B0A49_08949 [Cryomyces minteri]|uniref:Iron transport multicopper oxidase FET3 n=1 Tax=Cryomyces minteri TaxID=331657 RepID=A0A4U0WQR3_9PEZI|nr:hypothetical protein B0A49_12238 [Cryomyces minteri]TKA61688.1 hypothetical protein B0A49_09723 [Cryomyces minteri]TKA65028.1 hypothetical protein B0A49_08949 [Cryomyces minteri]
MLSVLSFAALSFLATSGFAKTVVYNWDITWVNASPDGFSRPVIGINGQWPCPTIEGNIGDRVMIHTRNMLGNETTSIHFHGLFQSGSNSMDGPAGVTQCPIPPGAKFTYDYTLDQPGTYWYHSHNKGQYIDGLRGPLIIHDKDAPYAEQVDEEVTLTLSDWYHDEAPGLIHYFQSVDNENNHNGAEPIPKGALMQDTQNPKISVKPNKKYLIRIINMSAFAGQFISIDGHQMTIVEVDGVYTVPQKTNQIYITAAQRYSVLISTKSDASQNFAIRAAMDEEMFDTIPADLNLNVYGFLVYDSKKPLPTPTPLTTFAAFDDFALVPQDRQRLLSKVDHQILMDFDFINDNGINRARINGVSYIPQKVPALYTALTTGSDATNPKVYGTNGNAFVVKPGEVVEIVLNNHDGGGHPWHLHGHNFQVIARSGENAGTYPGNAAAPAIPMRRDVVMVRKGGYVVIRYRADNPGVWLFHCHIEWHVEAGLSATIVESPMELQKSLRIPSDHMKICKDQGIPTAGNAVGNTANHLDLTGELTTPEVPYGALINPPKKPRSNRVARNFVA